MSVPAHGTRDQVVPVLPVRHRQLTLVQHDPRRGLVTEDPVEKAGHPRSKIGRLMTPQKIRMKIKPTVLFIPHIVSVPKRDNSNSHGGEGPTG